MGSFPFPDTAEKVRQEAERIAQQAKDAAEKAQQQIQDAGPKVEDEVWMKWDGAVELEILV